MGVITQAESFELFECLERLSLALSGDGMTDENKDKRSLASISGPFKTPFGLKASEAMRIM